MPVKSFRELLVWQKGMELVEETYSSVKLLPKEEMYGLSDQMRRAAVSIPSNIAEGQKRKSPKEFANFLSVSRGSVAELETQYIICERLGFLTGENTKKAIDLCHELYKMLNVLIDRINEKN